VKRALRYGTVALVTVVAVAATVVTRAPAAWAGDWLEARSKLRLLDARGTLWSGSALLALSDGRKMSAVPGRVSWRLDLSSLLSGRASAELSHPWIGAPLALAIGRDAVTLQAGGAELPASVLAALGTPFNTLRPGGSLQLRWTELALRRGTMAGDLQIDWRDAQSALSSVAPLGSYRLRISAAGEGARLRLDTMAGPLRLQGSGTLRGTRVSFKGLASADPDMRPALNGLLGVLGPRSGDNAILAVET
jgi:general secretion pathway protein N